MRIKTSVSQAALLGGVRSKRSGGILVEERTSRFARGRNLGNLYIVVEVSGPEGERDAVAQQIAETIRDTYYGRRGSITAGLEQALQEANNLLFYENRNSLPADRRTAGASCVVLRDGDLFVAQAGPAVVYLARDGQVIRLPEASPWLDGFPPEEMDATSLGESRDANTFLYHTPVSDRETVLLANCDLAQQIPPASWPRILALDPADAILEEVLAAARGGDLSALVVRLSEELPTAALAAPTRESDRPQAPATIQEEALDWFSSLRPKGRLQATGQAISHFLGSVWLGLLGLLRSMIPEKRGPAQPTAREAAAAPAPEKRGPAQRTAREAAAAPAPEKPAIARRPSHSDPVQKILIGVAIAIPIIVGIVVLVTLVQQNQAQRAEQDALWQEANARWQDAQQISEPAVTRGHLAAAQQNLEQLLERWPEYPGAQELSDKVQARMDVLNQIRRVRGISELNSYEQDAKLSRVVVQGTHVFVLDRHNDRVYHHQLDEELPRVLEPETKETVLVSKGDQVGDVLVADLVDMVWMPLGNTRQKASLVILESDGALLDYDPATDELQALQVAATDQWQFPALIGSHSGRFYVLDASANKIWRYNPTPDGYSLRPDEWLEEEIDLTGVIDMAIGDSIYLLYADGQIRKLTTGRLDTFEISDWDMPPRNPSALYTRPEEQTQWLYLGDQGNNRIVQASKEGKFKQQFRLAEPQEGQAGDPLAKLTNFFVDEIGGQAFALSGNKLYALVLPTSN